MKKSLLSLILFTIFITGCDENKQSPKQIEIPKVEVLDVKPQNIPLTFEFTARAQGSKETEVRARVGGILLKRNYKEGANLASACFRAISYGSGSIWNRTLPSSTSAPSL